MNNINQQYRKDALERANNKDQSALKLLVNDLLENPNDLISYIFNSIPDKNKKVAVIPSNELNKNTDLFNAILPSLLQEISEHGSSLDSTKRALVSARVRDICSLLVKARAKKSILEVLKFIELSSDFVRAAVTKEFSGASYRYRDQDMLWIVDVIKSSGPGGASSVNRKLMTTMMHVFAAKGIKVNINVEDFKLVLPDDKAKAFCSGMFFNKDADFCNNIYVDIMDDLISDMSDDDKLIFMPAVKAGLAPKVIEALRGIQRDDLLGGKKEVVWKIKKIAWLVEMTKDVRMTAKSLQNDLAMMAAVFMFRYAEDINKNRDKKKSVFSDPMHAESVELIKGVIGTLKDMVDSDFFRNKISEMMNVLQSDFRAPEEEKSAVSSWMLKFLSGQLIENDAKPVVGMTL